MNALYTLFNDNVELALRQSLKHPYSAVLPKDEFEQNTLIALWELCSKYDPTRGSMDTFVCLYLNSALTRVWERYTESYEPYTVEEHTYCPQDEVIADILIDDVISYITAIANRKGDCTKACLPYIVENIKRGDYIIKKSEVAKELPYARSTVNVTIDHMRRLIKYYALRTQQITF